jgi:hypothetical protein
MRKASGLFSISLYTSSQSIRAVNLSGEWSISWVKEIPHVSWVVWVALLVELAAIEAIKKQVNSATQGIITARKTT